MTGPRDYGFINWLLALGRGLPMCNVAGAMPLGPAWEASVAPFGPLVTE
jgi:hypothetical protein